MSMGLGPCSVRSWVELARHPPKGGALKSNLCIGQDILTVMCKIPIPPQSSSKNLSPVAEIPQAFHTRSAAGISHGGFLGTQSPSFGMHPIPQRGNGDPSWVLKVCAMVEEQFAVGTSPGRDSKLGLPGLGAL